MCSDINDAQVLAVPAPTPLSLRAGGQRASDGTESPWTGVTGHSQLWPHVPVGQALGGIAPTGHVGDQPFPRRVPSPRGAGRRQAAGVRAAGAKHRE